jgi:hypothetical protein
LDLGREEVVKEESWSFMRSLFDGLAISLILSSSGCSQLSLEA